MGKRISKKRSTLKTFVFYFLIILGIFLTYLIGVILLGTFTDYKPKSVENLDVKNVSNITLDSSSLVIFDWNIGYAGLGKEMDFFMDGGKTSVPPKKYVEKYLAGIANTILRNKADIYLLQEIDRNSKRSYYIDELEYLIDNIFDDQYNVVFAYNYKVSFVPVPLFKPMGKVSSGLSTISKYVILEAKRISLPGEYSWPTKLFQLDRCLLLTRFATYNGKNLVVLNIHPSAYDSGGKLRKQQLDYILKVASDEYEKGNYVIIGGDWNSELVEDSNFEYTETKPEFYVELPESLKLQGWKWAFDKTVPTNRSVSAPYEENKTFVTVIDGFYVSPNIDVEWVKNLDLQFENSDHNPVVMKVILK